MAVNGDRSSTRAYAGSSPGTAPTTGDGLRVALLDSDVPASGGNGRRTEGSVRKGGMLAAKRKTASLIGASGPNFSDPARFLEDS